MQIQSSGLQPIHFAALESDVTSVQFLVEAPVPGELKRICMIHIYNYIYNIYLYVFIYIYISAG